MSLKNDIFHEMASARGRQRYGSVQNADSFDESKHPRADDGKFGKGGGGAKGDKKETKAKKPEAKKEKSGSGPKQVSREDWFGAVKAVRPYMWDRKSPDELTLIFQGYKTQDAYDAEAKLMKLGGSVMDMKFDKHSGCTFVTVKEPKGLEKPEE